MYFQDKIWNKESVESTYNKECFVFYFSHPLTDPLNPHLFWVLSGKLLTSHCIDHFNGFFSLFPLATSLVQAAKEGRSNELQLGNEIILSVLVDRWRFIELLSQTASIFTNSFISE